MILTTLEQPILAAVPALAAFTFKFLLIGGFVAFVILFKPMLLGIWRATKLHLKQYFSKEQQNLRLNLKNRQLIYKAVNDLDGHSPSLAAEIRALSARI
ncbi:hypothetical protein [Solimicrobium silvestre]|uniref:Uncharacterized protein n=1 Tax=Solimicrobium silvestre TaxID=2099400 RepID=A0A2S9H0G8_9BURK|nr:hypothetical protein [Solimicrobium silvestre]PRC93356.1 hypothetical protein S2091_2094 [Solimicrobium silvestre]